LPDGELGLWQWCQRFVEDSNLGISAVRLLMLSAGSGAVAGLVAGIWAASSIVGVAVAAVAAAIPLFYVSSRRVARTRKMCDQLPEAFDVMSRAVRGGQTVSSAMQLIADDLGPPLANEFAFCSQQQSFGLSQDVALRELARRTGIVELQMFVVALLIQQRSGGNLVELLDNLSGVIRKRLLLQGKLKALTSEGRMQASVLIVLPVIMFFAMWGLNPTYAEILLARPWLLAGTATSVLIGSLWIVKIVQIDF
jgi:tight adherence protein B